MSAPDAVPDEMPEFSLSGRDGPELDEQLLDAILTRQQLSPEAPGQAIVVAEMLSSLADPVYSGHLAGEEAARSAFARAVSPALGRRGRHAARRPARPAPARRTRRVSVRLAAACAVAAAGLSGTVAAYAGALPAPVQDLAHFTIGAPSPPPPGPHDRPRPGPGQPGGTPGTAPASHPAMPGKGTTGEARGNSRSNGAHKAESARGRAGSAGKGKGKGHSKLPPGAARGDAEENAGASNKPQATKSAGGPGPGAKNAHGKTAG